MQVDFMNLLVAAQIRELAKELRAEAVAKEIPGRSTEDNNLRKEKERAMPLDPFIPQAFDELSKTMSIVSAHIRMRSQQGAA